MNRNPRPQPPLRRRGVSHEPLYHPSLYHFTCYGAYRVGTNHEYRHTAGQCTGLHTELEHVDDWKKLSERDALVHFSNMTNEHSPNNNNDHQVDLQVESLPAIPHAIVYTKLDTVPSLPDYHYYKSYGATHLYLLVLRQDEQDDDSETIVGVYPDCSVGASVSDSGVGKNVVKVSSLHLGLTDIKVARYGEVYDEAPQQEADSSKPQESNTTTTTTTTTTSQKKTNPSDPTPANEPMEAPFSKVWVMSKKIASSMKTNAKIVQEATQDRFAARTIAAGQRISSEFVRTVKRTGTTMGKFIESMWQDDDDTRK